MTAPRPQILLLVALLVACFGLAARLGPQFQAWPGSRNTGDILNVVLGESRRLFAKSAFAEADKYYHAGYYPTMFDDNTAFQTAHMAADTGAVKSQNQGDEQGFLGQPRNWLDAFGRNFMPNRHTHLDEGGADDLGDSEDVREILPWMKLSADLDPDNVETYTVTAYWLRQRMHNVPEAEAVLHEGLRNCPESPELFFELGRLYFENYHDRDRSRNVWEHGVRLWLKLDPQVRLGHQPIRDLVGDWVNRPTNLVPAQQANPLCMEQLCTHLSKLEEQADHLPQAIEWLAAAKKVAVQPGSIQQWMDTLNYKLGQELNPVLKPLF